MKYLCSRPTLKAWHHQPQLIESLGTRGKMVRRSFIITTILMLILNLTDFVHTVLKIMQFVVRNHLIVLYEFCCVLVFSWIK